MPTRAVDSGRPAPALNPRALPVSIPWPECFGCGSRIRLQVDPVVPAAGAEPGVEYVLVPAAKKAAHPGGHAVGLAAPHDRGASSLARRWVAPRLLRRGWYGPLNPPSSSRGKNSSSKVLILPVLPHVSPATSVARQAGVAVGRGRPPGRRSSPPGVEDDSRRSLRFDPGATPQASVDGHLRPSPGRTNLTVHGGQGTPPGHPRGSTPYLSSAGALPRAMPWQMPGHRRDGRCRGACAGSGAGAHAGCPLRRCRGAAGAHAGRRIRFRAKLEPSCATDSERTGALIVCTGRAAG